MLKSHADFPNLFADKLAKVCGIDPEAFNDRIFEKEVRAYGNLRAIRLQEHPVSGRFDLQHLCRIHQFLFDGVSSYAGSVRRYGLKGHDVVFATPAQMDQVFAHKLPLLLDTLAKSDTLAEKAQTLARMANDINFAHPFREGNGRSTRLFLEQLAQHHGLTLDLSQFVASDQARWNEASSRALAGDLAPLVKIFKDITMWQEAKHILALHQAHLAAKGVSPADMAAQHDRLQKHLLSMDKVGVHGFVENLYEQLNLQSHKRTDQSPPAPDYT